jgi:hypothetical protein
VDVGAMDGAEGDVAFCMGKDTSGNLAAATKAFNERFPEIKAELIEFSTSADEQRAQSVQRQEAESGECDVFWADVIWTAEVDLRHDAVHGDAQGGDHPGDARVGRLRREAVGHAAADPRRVPLLPDRPGLRPPETW